MKAEVNLSWKLLEAVLKNDETAIRNTIAEGADINGIYEEKKFLSVTTYCSALELALEKEHYHLVPLLLELGADPKILSAGIIKTLIKNERLYEIGLLLKAGLSFQRRFSERNIDDHYDLIESAIRQEKFGLLQVVLLHATDLKEFEANWENRLALSYLYSAKATEMILNYREHDLNLPVRLDNNRTLLVEALKDKKSDTALLLIDRGADIESTDKLGFFPLYLAVRSKDIVVARKLLEKGANPNRTYGEDTLVSLAAKNADYKMLQLFTEFNADMNARTATGKKPIECIPNYEQFLSFMLLFEK